MLLQADCPAASKIAELAIIGFSQKKRNGKVKKPDIRPESFEEKLRNGAYLEARLSIKEFFAATQMVFLHPEESVL